MAPRLAQHAAGPLALLRRGSERGRAGPAGVGSTSGRRRSRAGAGQGSGRPVAVLCTSGTAAANFHPAVIEADESAVPLLVLTADRPPELRGTGPARRWTRSSCTVGGPLVHRGRGARPGPAWRATGGRWPAGPGRRRRASSGTLPGPVHLNIPFRDPLVLPPYADPPAAAVPGLPGRGLTGGRRRLLAGRPAGAPGRGPPRPGRRLAEPLELPWSERGVLVCGDGDYDAAALVELAEQAGWPVLAEPSSGARRGPRPDRIPVPARRAGVHGGSPA